MTCFSDRSRFLLDLLKTGAAKAPRPTNFATGPTRLRVVRRSFQEITAIKEGLFRSVLIQNDLFWFGGFGITLSLSLVTTSRAL